jgi:DNA-binding NtrC family response regulator
MQAMTPPAYEPVETVSTGAAIYRINPGGSPAKLPAAAPIAPERCRAVVVSGPAIQRDEVRAALRSTGFEIVMLDDTTMAVDALLSLSPDVVILDLTVRNEETTSILKRCREADTQLPIVAIVAPHDIGAAVEATRIGAFDVIAEPACRARLQALLDRAATQHRFNLESRSLKAVLERATGVSSIIRGESQAIRNLRETILRMAPKPVDATIIGETGTGKELVARCLHDFSMRTGHFVAINCAAIPENLFESELFGHEPGAYTGATRQRVGKLEYANGGTLFLDEIESLPLPLQAKLLRALQERQIERLGANRPIPIDLRVVVATKVDLQKLAADGSFRPDLFYRLNVLRLEIPPLRARLDDIPMLFEHFVQEAAVKFQQKACALTLELKQKLLAYSWPGNVRELRNAAERFQLGLPLALGTDEEQAAAVSLKTVLASVERALLQDSLQRYNGCVASASQALGLTAATFYRRLRAYGIATADHR